MRIQTYKDCETNKSKPTLLSIEQGTVFKFINPCDQGTAHPMLKVNQLNINAKRLKDYRRTQENPVVFLNLNNDTIHVYDGGNYDVRIIKNVTICHE
jgi:hypothetical protein